MSNVFALTQAGYRFGADDGTEAAHTLLGTQSLPLAIDVSGGDVDRILRILLNETGAGSISGATTDDYQLQYSKNGGAFTNVTTSSSNVVAFASANLTDAGTTTERVTGGSGSFVAGEISEDGLVDDRQITANNHSEMVYTVRFVQADLAENDSLTFRVLLNGATTGLTYSSTPTAVIAVHRAAGVGALALAGALVGLAFLGPSTGALALTGETPTVQITEASPTLTPGVGALTLSGTTPVLGYTIPISAGSLTATGTSPALREAYPVSAGSLTLSGTTPVLSHTLPLGAGALTLTGETPVLLGLNVISPDPGALTLTGTTPTLSSTIPIGAGSLTLTGQALTLGLVTGPQPPVGTLTLSGHYIGVAFNGPSTGALVFTGTAPTIGSTSNVVATPDAGSLTLAGEYVDLVYQGPDVSELRFTGYAPDVITIHKTAQPGVGTLTLTTTTPVVAKGIPVGAVALSLTGQAVMVSKTVLMTAGTLTLSGQALTLGRSREPGVGALTFTGTAPTVAFGAPFQPAAGTLTFTGTLPAVALIIPVSEGVVTLTGTNPALGFTNPATLPIEHGELTLTGQSVSVGDGIGVGVGTLTFTGQAPSIQAASVIRSPTAGALSLTGQTPTVQIDVPMFPGVAALTLTGTPSVIGLRYGIPVGSLTLTGPEPSPILSGADVIEATPEHIVIVRADYSVIRVRPDADIIVVRRSNG